MQIEVQDPAFTTQQLAVETAGIFSGPKLLLNGVPVEKSKEIYTVANDAGEEVAVKLKYNYFDPIPKIEIGGAVEALADPLAWFEWLWIGLPLLLVAIGGAIGGALGMVAATANGRVFRSGNSTAQKWIYSLVITALTFSLFAAIAKSVQSLRTPSVESQLEEAAAEINRGGQKMVDKVTRLDGASAGPGKLLTLRYTMLNMTPANAPSPAVLQALLAPDIKRSVCVSEMRQLLDRDIAVKFVYHEAGGSPFGEIRILRWDCK